MTGSAGGELGQPQNLAVSLMLDEETYAPERHASFKRCLWCRMYCPGLPRGDVASHLANSKQRNRLRLITTDFSAGEISCSLTSTVTQGTEINAEHCKNDDVLLAA